MTRILIVDDEEMSRTVMEEIFGRYGTSVSVSTGQDALRVFEKALQRKTPFDLVVLDISLEDLSGLAVLKKIKTMEKRWELAPADPCTVVMVTATSEKDVVVDCIRSGCKGYFIKPLNPAAVERKMGELGFSPVA